MIEMIAVNIKLPDSLVAKMEELSKKDGITLDYFVSLAVAEKYHLGFQKVYIQEQAKRANKKISQCLKLIPNREPHVYDQVVANL